MDMIVIVIVSYCAIFIANKLELYFMIMVSDDEDHRHDKGRVFGCVR